MKKTEFLKIISDQILYSKADCTETILKKITVDSREVESGTIFFCMKGEKRDGHNYIDEAFNKGASLVIGEDIAERDNYIRVISVKKILEKISPGFYDHPHKKLRLIGITGTNGKTTISYMIENALKDIGLTAVIGTLGYKMPGGSMDAPNTTPFVWKWYELLAKMVSENVDTVISEVSSHGLEQRRISGTKFDVAVFTNLSRDHLDYHNDMDSYYNAKKKLFFEHLKRNGSAIINIDNIYGKKLYNELDGDVIRKSVSLHDKNADMYVKVIEKSLTGSTAIFKYGDKQIEKLMPMIGEFNVYNAACAVMACESFLGFEKSLDRICERITVPGRMEMVGDLPIYIDYAHTPDALNNILSSAKNTLFKGRLIVVFGAGGDRDKGKRPLMGKTVSETADIAIITNDNPRNENPREIVDQIMKGFGKSSCSTETILDRKKAIQRAIELMNSGDIVIIAGKGAENYQITGSEKKFFSDREEVLSYLEEMKKNV